tara:strand:+ start:69236 stop:69787 length:552 start_codon:yes stop_codon:yes gene_type:complete
MRKLRIVWVQDASPIGFIVSKKTIELLKEFYNVDSFRLYDKDQMYGHYYEEECNKPFIKECEKYLRANKDQFYMFYDINKLDEIWEVCELPFEYEMVKTNSEFSPEIQYANGHIEMGNINLNIKEMRTKSIKESKFFTFHKELMGFKFYKEGKIVHKYELFLSGYKTSDLKNGLTDVEIIRTR